MHIGLIELESLIWGTQTVLVVTLLIFWMGCRLLFIFTARFSNHSEQRELWVCLCVRLYAGNKPIIGIAFHSSITFLSCRIPWSARMCIMSARQVFDWGVRSLFSCGWVLARGVWCVSQLWRCLTPFAFECSFKACLAECFPPHNLAPFSNPLHLLLSIPSSALCFFVFPRYTFPSVLHCVLYPGGQCVLGQCLFAGMWPSKTQLWPLRRSKCQTALMETGEQHGSCENNLCLFICIIFPTSCFSVLLEVELIVDQVYFV